MSRPLRSDELAVIEACRTATLATWQGESAPRLVPVCFVVATTDGGADVRLWTPLDEKPKRSEDVRDLARVRDILAQPSVRLLFERWSEDWSQLAWVRVGGRARLIEPAAEAVAHASAVQALRAKYPQYRHHRLEASPLIEVRVTSAGSWQA
jgi:PPOX class probable F420-dependent enzyme